jgi:hypothetical protein
MPDSGLERDNRGDNNQNESKERMACPVTASERFLGPGFCRVSGRCSCFSSARVNSGEPSGRPLKVLSRIALG